MVRLAIVGAFLCCGDGSRVGINFIWMEQMSDRIKELAEQANILIGKDSYGKFAVVPGHEKDPISRQGKAESYNALEKFAELIVEECLNLVDQGGEFVSRPKLVEKIKEHFEVEE